MKKKHPKPPWLAGKLLTRVSDMRVWLGTGNQGWEIRGGYNDANYGHYRWLYCFNVKIHQHVDMSFDTLLRLYREGNYLPETVTHDPIWVTACRQQWARTYYDWDGVSVLPPCNDDSRVDTLFNDALELVQRDFVGGYGSGAPENDNWDLVEDGTYLNARYALLGRSGGWLTLTDFMGYKLHSSSIHNLLDEFSEDEIRKLYEHIRHLAWYARNREYLKDIQATAAYQFFGVGCAAVRTPTLDEYQAFCNAELRAQFVHEVVPDRARLIGGKLRRPRAQAVTAAAPAAIFTPGKRRFITRG